MENTLNELCDLRSGSVAFEKRASGALKTFYFCANIRFIKIITLSGLSALSKLDFLVIVLYIVGTMIAE
jgi:hypothetical protein